MIKVLLADDQELIRQSLSFVMSKQEDIEMVGTAANGCEALELVEEKQPDVVLLDIRMPEMDGVECTRRIKQEFPGIKVIILTTFDDDDYVFDALRYGASGYLLKGVSVDGLTNAVREAARGGSIIAPDVASKVLQMFSRMAQGDVQVRVNKKKCAGADQDGAAGHPRGGLRPLQQGDRGQTLSLRRHGAQLHQQHPAQAGTP